MLPHPPVLAVGPAIRMVPVVIIVILSAPAWLTWPFLSATRQRAVLEMVNALARWAQGEPLATERPEAPDKAAGTAGQT